MPPRSVLRLAEPVEDPAAAGQALELLVPGLVRELEARQLGARRLALSGYRVDGSVALASVATALPSREPKHLQRLLVDRAAALNPGFGFDGFALEASWCEPLGAVQDGLEGGVPAGIAVARLVDRLSVKLGAERVRRPQPRASHLPERASGWRPALAEAQPCQPAPALPPRPQRMLDVPEAIAVIYATPEGLPRRFLWRRATHDVARAEGPERISPEWWRAPAGTRLRDYYRVEDKAGRRFWIYREGVVGDGRGGAPLWFLHGLFG
jgi:protein ImuB